MGTMVRRLSNLQDAPKLAEERKEAFAKFKKAIENFATYYRLPAADGEKLCLTLNAIPNQVWVRERRLLLGDDPDCMPGGDCQDLDLMALLVGWQSVTVRDALSGKLWPTPATWTDLSRKERDRAGKLGKRFYRQAVSLKNGRPPYRYSWLANHFATIIAEALDRSSRAARHRNQGTTETVSPADNFLYGPHVRHETNRIPGQEPYYSRPLPYSYRQKKPSSPALDLLHATLELALPASGALDPAFLVELIDPKRVARRKSK